jgi:hypothetical protein
MLEDHDGLTGGWSHQLEMMGDRFAVCADRRPACGVLRVGAAGKGVVGYTTAPARVDWAISTRGRGWFVACCRCSLLPQQPIF